MLNRMKEALGDTKTLKDGFIHFIVADVILAAFLGGSLEFVILFFMKYRALFLFHGIGGIVVESVVTWLSVMMSARLMRRSRDADAMGIALIATTFSVISTLVVLPYIAFFSEISRVTELYLFIKEALHACIFYTATMIYFSGFSPTVLLKKPSSLAS